MSGKQFLYIAIATLITVILWLGVDIVSSRNRVQISPEIQRTLEPVNPNLDQNIINDL